MTEKEEMEQFLNHYEYERAYKISVGRMKRDIADARKEINGILDTLEKSIDGIMDSARCMEGGGVSCGKVWNLYPNNPKILGLQATVDHIKNLKSSKYPFEDILKVLESDNTTK